MARASPPNLILGQATLTVTAGNASRTYGTANPAFSATAAGALINGDTFNFTGDPLSQPSSSPVGTYSDRSGRHRQSNLVADYNLVYDQRHPHHRPSHSDGHRR